MLYRYDDAGTGPTVLLTHGTFSNIDTLTPLAAFLTQQGLRVYAIEWRGRMSRPGVFTYDDLAQAEMSEAIQTIDAPQGLHLIGHSGGGLAFILALHLNAKLRLMIRSLTCLAAQATHLHQSSLRFRTGLRLVRVFGHLFGYWPVRMIGLGICTESAALQSQWMNWNRANCMTDQNGNNVYAGLSDWALPALIIAAQQDTDIAPKAGCKAVADAFGSTGKFHVAMLASDGEDFTHSRLIRSRTAARTLWPRVTQFIQDHNGPDG